MINKEVLNIKVLKKVLLFIIAPTLYSTLLAAQSVGINTSSPHASAILDVNSNTKGMLIPRTSSTSRMAIANPANGLMIYDTTTSSFWFYNGSAWAPVADGNNTWNLSGNTGINPTTHYIGTGDNQPLHFKVNNTWAGEIHPTSWNVFLGVSAGQSNTSGQANTAIGEHSLFTNTTGTSNTAIGSFALNSNTIGNENVATGSLTLFFNTAGNQNTADGGRALYNNTTGNNNTANGFQALALNSEGNDNTAIGFQALFTNTSSFNTATGSQALFSNTTGTENTANGYLALSSNTTGSENTAHGTYALNANTTGNYNTAVGQNALGVNTTGTSNTATGRAALTFNSTGNFNTADGYETLYFNTTGNQNTAIGYQALSYSNSFNNTASGYKALSLNTTGDNNTAIGANSLSFNYTGYGNTASGSGALAYNGTGNYNTANGVSVLGSNSSGNYNTAMGLSSLALNSTGNYNTAIGVNALNNNTEGSLNIAIGYGSGTHSSTPGIYNTISIGNDDILNAYQNQVLIGNNSIGWIGGKVTWSTYSDARIKNTIMEDVKGLDFILRLRPVTYHVSNKAMTTVTGNKETPDFPGKYDNEKVKYTGFIAQEVEQAAKAAGYEFSGYAAPKNQWGLYTISYEQFVVPLVKAIQEQQVIIEEQNKKIDILMKELQQIKDKLQ